MVQVNKLDLEKVLNAFWELSDADGTSQEERQAALRVQKEAGIETEWDHARELQASTPDL